MKSLKINEDWDLELDENGNLIMVEGEEELLQAACHAIFTFKGEDPFNINNGIPYFEEILFKKKNKNLIEAYMKNEVKDIDGIINIMIIDSKEEESNNYFFNILRNFKKNVVIITNEE